MEPNNPNEMDKVKEVLSCFICTAKVLDPVLCPKCKKLFCSKCIKKWLNNNDNKCPNCQNITPFEKMISLPFMNHFSSFFVKEINNNKRISQSINIFNDVKNENGDGDEDNHNNKDKLLSKSYFFINNNNDFKLDDDDNKKKEGFCPKHNEKFEYYCVNCNTNHCSKCLTILSEESKIHYDHKIISIDKKNKFNLEKAKEDIKNLSKATNQLLIYKDNVEKEKLVVKRKEEFMKTLMNNLNEKYARINDNKKYRLEMKLELLEKHIKSINDLRNNYAELINNFIERDNEDSFKKFKEKIMDYKNVDKYKYLQSINSSLKPNLNIYETDYVAVDVDLYNETIGETDFNIEGIDQQIHCKLGGEAIDEVCINLLINLEGKENQSYNGFLLIKSKNKDRITYINLDEEMILDKILILGKTIVKSGLSSIIDEQNKLHIKLILAHININ